MYIANWANELDAEAMQDDIKHELHPANLADPKGMFMADTSPERVAVLLQMALDHWLEYHGEDEDDEPLPTGKWVLREESHPDHLIWVWKDDSDGGERIWAIIREASVVSLPLKAAEGADSVVKAAS